VRKLRESGLFVHCEDCGTLFVDLVGMRFAHVCGETAGQVVEDPTTGAKYISTTSPALKWHETRLYKRVVGEQ